QLLAGEVRQHRRLESLEVIGLERLVHALPPDLVRRRGLPHDELVVRAAPRVRCGDGAERPALGDHALGATHRVLVELGWPEVPMDGALGRESRGLQRGGPSAFGGAGGMRGHAFGSGQGVRRGPAARATLRVVIEGLLATDRHRGHKSFFVKELCYRPALRVSSRAPRLWGTVVSSCASPRMLATLPTGETGPIADAVLRPAAPDVSL